MPQLDLTAAEIALIEERRRVQAAAAPTWEPTAAASVPVLEKAAAFDRLHALALGIYAETMRNGYEDDDADHWCYEAVMELLGPGVWAVINRVIQ